MKRGTRVSPLGYYLDWWGPIQGTVTHLDGDEGGEYRIDDPDEVWVVWDGDDGEWMCIEDLRVVE